TSPSGPQVVPHTTVSPSSVPQTTVSPSLVDQTPAGQSAPPQLDPQTTFSAVAALDHHSPHVTGWPSAALVQPHPVVRNHALTPGITRPPVRRRLPQMTSPAHALSAGYVVDGLTK